MRWETITSLRCTCSLLMDLTAHLHVCVFIQIAFVSEEVNCKSSSTRVAKLKLIFSSTDRFYCAWFVSQLATLLLDLKRCSILQIAAFFTLTVRSRFPFHVHLLSFIVLQVILSGSMRTLCYPSKALWKPGGRNLSSGDNLSLWY